MLKEERKKEIDTELLALSSEYLNFCLNSQLEFNSIIFYHDLYDKRYTI